jgi:hypothetical protein
MKKLFYVHLYVLVALFVFIIFLSTNSTAYATGVTYTVCASGCDYTYINEAFGTPGISEDTVQVTSGYVYDQLIEGTGINIPQDVTLMCDAGADTIGSDSDSQAGIGFNPGSVLQGCTIENANLGAYTQTDIKILDNTFTGTSGVGIFLNNTDTFEVSGNTNIHTINIGASDNGVVDDNTFYCINESQCLYLGGVGAITTYTDTLQTSDNVVISNNTFNSTSIVNTQIMFFDGGANIDFTGNTLIYENIIDSNFTTMINLQSIDINLENNIFVMPEKAAPADDGTIAINVSLYDGDMNLEASHNTILMSTQDSVNTNSGCFSTYENNMHASTSALNVDWQYNICANRSTSSGGAGINLDYDTATTTSVSFNEENNGFYNLGIVLNDNDGVFTTADSSNIYSNPIFQTEDADSDNDYDVAPMSNYLDVNGTLDIGATDAAREDTYEIDDDCTVDYTSCFSNFTSTLDHVLRSGDTVTIGAGSYDPINLPDDLTGITLIGDGAVIDATGVAQGISAEGLSDSTIEGFEIENANTETFVYNMFSWAMNHSGINYNSITPTSLYIYSTDCTQNIIISSPYTDVTGQNGIGTSDLGLFLVHVPDGSGPGEDLDITAYLPNSTGSTPAEIETACGQPQSLFITYVSNVFELQPDGDYVFDDTAVANAGITILGDGSDPFLHKIVSKAAGVYLSNSTGNNISDMTFSNNEVDIYFASGSTDNTVSESVFSGNTNDVYTESSGDNNLSDSTFDITSLSVNNSGAINILYTVDATITSASTTLPITGATITVRNNGSSIVNTLTTDSSGFASSSILATVIENGDPLVVTSGDLNPFSFKVSATGYLSETTSNVTLATPYSLAASLDEGTDPVEDSGGSSGSSGSYTKKKSPVVVVNNPVTPQPLTNKAILLSTIAKLLSSFPDLTVRDERIEVLVLQLFLNNSGFPIASSGPGSPGFETSYFGPLTEAALARFQASNNILPSIGYFGPVTRSFLSGF